MWWFLFLLAMPCVGRNGLNVLDGKTYPHHPVMIQVPQLSYKLEPGLLTEHCGLKVPQHFDCRNLCNETQYQWFLSWFSQFGFVSIALTDYLLASRKLLAYSTVEPFHVFLGDRMSGLVRGCSATVRLLLALINQWLDSNKYLTIHIAGDVWELTTTHESHRHFAVEYPKLPQLNPSRFNYYRDVPARRLLCQEHQAYLDARLSHSLVNLPLMDDDYGRLDEDLACSDNLS